RAFAQIPGMMARVELDLLRDLAAQSRGTIVELGSFVGLSTIALCLGAREAGVEVVTIDEFGADLDQIVASIRGFYAHGGLQAPRWALSGPGDQVLADNLRAFGVSARIIKGLSWQAAALVDGPVGLLFVDADHRRPAIEQDLAAWGPKLLLDAIVAFDDYG